MKIFTAEQQRAADAYTIANEPIASIDLMERASQKCFDRIQELYPELKRIAIYCGVGNNGGDGLVLARLFREAGVEVTCYVVPFSNHPSADFTTNLERLKNVQEVQEITEETQIEIPSGVDLVLDALFGTGLSRPIEGLTSKVVQAINQSTETVVAIDCPSGLFTEDNENNVLDAVIQADITLTFESPKLAFLFPENAKYVGRWEVVPIGLHPSYLAAEATPYQLLTLAGVQQLIAPRPKFSHKGNYGHALIAAGSKGKMGAAILAAKACLRTGAGLLTTQVPSCGYTIMQTTVPEAMCLVDEHEDFIGPHAFKKHNAFGIGPGIGNQKATQNAVKAEIQNSTDPLILDADALNILADNKTWFSFIPNGSILTPHLGEFERLIGKIANPYARLQKQREFAQRYGVFVLLKGAYSAIAAPDGKVYFNTTGNPGMATAGSGDVLTGMLTSLLAQRYAPLSVVIIGVYLHGLAGDYAATEIGMDALIASDIIDAIGPAFEFLRGNKL